MSDRPQYRGHNEPSSPVPPLAKGDENGPDSQAKDDRHDGDVRGAGLDVLVQVVLEDLVQENNRSWSINGRGGDGKGGEWEERKKVREDALCPRGDIYTGA